MRGPGRVLGAMCLAVSLTGCLYEEAKRAADQIGAGRYEDFVAQFGAPAETDHTFTGKFRATWKSSITNTEGRISTDRLILVFDKQGLLEKVTYKDGADDHHLINFFSGSFTCDERGNYPGGPAWDRSEPKGNMTPDTLPERRGSSQGRAAGWKSRK